MLLLLAPLVRRITPHLGALVAVSGLATLWAIYAQSMAAGPLAIAFVGLAFWWSLVRLDPAPVPARCSGCATGCVECRERIDAL